MSKSPALRIDNGIDAKNRKKLADGLAALLADTFTLYLKTHNFHWNVTGPMFNSLHAMFMTQYTELWTSLDEIAERIRALDHIAPGSSAQFASLSSVKEETGVPDWRAMVEQLVEGNDACAKTARKVFKMADAADDQPTADLLTLRLSTHEKTAWMLRALLK